MEKHAHTTSFFISRTALWHFFVNFVIVSFKKQQPLFF